MKNNITELVFILDRSGSMAGLESDTIGGFNAMIEKQKKEDGACLVTTVLFDHESITLHDRVSLADIRPLGDDDYTVRGSTALLDAVGSTIEHIEMIHKYIRPEDVPAKTLFVITTDGMENASRKYSGADVKKLVEKAKEKGWEFIFLGANIDAAETAARFGVDRKNAVNYHADHIGVGVVYDAVSEAITSVRTAKCAAPLAENWSESINHDFKGRKKQSR